MSDRPTSGEYLAERAMFLHDGPPLACLKEQCRGRASMLSPERSGGF